MNIQSLFEIQKNYNDTLSINEDLDLYKIRTRKNLEFVVNLSDLANETTCFNYLACNTKNIDIDKVLDKYITCISQVLSLGIDHNYGDLVEVSIAPNDYCLSDQFLNLYVDINDLIASPSLDHYITLFEDLLSLGLTFGFSEELIQKKFEEQLNSLLVV